MEHFVGHSQDGGSEVKYRLTSLQIHYDFSI